MLYLVQDPQQQQETFELDVYGKRGITIIHGRGSYVWDHQDHHYLDFIAGHGALNLGHAHPKLLGTLYSQAQDLMLCPGSFYTPTKANYLKDLVQATGMHRAFLSNSGTESVEAAIKFARISTGRHGIVACKRGFHGRTYGSLSATFNPKYKKGCGPLLADVKHIGFNKIEDLQAIDEQDAAIIIELVQGEGGVFVADPEWVQAIVARCRETGTLLIVDEVQTGFGRTGKLFACEHYQLVPDILCLAKSIAGGYPMGATVVNETVSVKIGQHGSTFGGNPLGCALARVVLQTMRLENLPEQSAELAQWFVNELERRDLTMVREIRHLGMMIGIELKVKVRPIIQALAEEGLLALSAGNTVLRLLPPLTTTRGEMEAALKKLLKVLH